MSDCSSREAGPATLLPGWGIAGNLGIETMPIEEEQLDALMTRLADGDRAVFTRVFELLWSPIHRLCTSLLKNEADAADAAQEAMQKILERAPADYDRTRAAMPWALAIAGWECKTIARKRGRRREIDEEPGEMRASSDAEEAIIQRDLTAAALAALGVCYRASPRVWYRWCWRFAPTTCTRAGQTAAERSACRLACSAEPSRVWPWQASAISVGPACGSGCRRRALLY